VFGRIRPSGTRRGDPYLSFPLDKLFILLSVENSDNNSLNDYYNHGGIMSPYRIDLRTERIKGNALATSGATRRSILVEV